MSMKNILTLIYVVLGCFLSSISSALDLNAGSSHYDSPDFKQAQKFRIWDFERWAAMQQKKFSGALVSYFENSDQIFVLSRNLEIGSIDKKKEIVLKNWPLTRWKTETENPSLSKFTNPGPSQDTNYGDELIHYIVSSPKGFGCYTDTPLRYGDLENDGKNEIVLFLGDRDQLMDLVVFSPSQEKVVFGVRLGINNSTLNHIPNYTDYEYVAKFDGRSSYQANRDYAKIYQGDFDTSNGLQSEMIVWRKAFLSHHVDSGQKGFYLDGSSFEHYVFENNEYVLKETDDSVIQSWLADKQLTWSKGYPSVSECEWEEGQLIPEMHDPLLNDPDVLK